MEGSSRVRLEYLDGLRGLAALYVLLGHVYVAMRPQLSPVFLKLLKPLDAGHCAVAVFIVLSGYLLMLPVVRSADGRLRGGWFPYIRRRARRIMPPYYAALVISVLLALAFPRIVRPGDLSWGSLTSHLFLVHNFSPRHVDAINGPMWSVALEWQIYFFLPFVFVPVWSRLGALALFVTGGLLGLAPHFLLPVGFNFDWTYPWYLWLFAMGGTAAAINFSPHPKMTWVREGVPWGVVATILIALSVFLLTFRLRWAFEHLWMTDALLGVTTGASIVCCTRALLHTVSPDGDVIAAHQAGRAITRRSLVLWVVSLLESRPVEILGTFSYSLYLLHEPLLLAISGMVSPYISSPVVLLLVHFLLITPVVIGFCFLCYLAFERPFVVQKRARNSRSTANAVGAAALDQPTVC